MLRSLNQVKATWALQWQPQGRIGSVTPKLVHPFMHKPYNCEALVICDLGG